MADSLSIFCGETVGFIQVKSFFDSGSLREDIFVFCFFVFLLIKKSKKN
jgi:hypothetical protein